MDRLHAKGYISDPESQAKSVVMTEEGERVAQKLFGEHFGGVASDECPRSPVEFTPFRGQVNCFRLAARV